MHKQLTLYRLIIKILASSVILVIIMTACAFAGTKNITLGNLISKSVDEQTQLARLIFYQVRLPRVFCGMIVGASLACAGTVFQGLLRNPLADPYILGISSGAGLGAVIAGITGISFSLMGIETLGIFAFAGALATVWIVWIIGTAAGKKNLTSLLLTGVVINSFFSAAMMFLISIAKSNDVQSTLIWLMGNITETASSSLIAAGILLCIGMMILFYIAPELNLISFGSEDALSMGTNPERVRLISFAVASMMTAVAVSLSGLVGFVGLIVPHAIRLVAGPDHRLLLPLSAVYGAMFVVVTDTLARTIISPDQLPVGIITALVGGPFFITLLLRYSKKVSLGAR